MRQAEERMIGGVHVTDAGDGPPVLLLHGIGSSAASFSSQQDVLSRRFRVLAWDAPGYARSDDAAQAPGMDGYADVAAEVLRATDAVPAHVVGLSWGGVIAVRLAIRHPASVRSLVLADSTRGSATEPAKAAAMRARAAELADDGPQAFAAARAPRLLSPDAAPWLLEQVAASMTAAVRLPGYGQAAEAMAETDHTTLLARIRVPTLVLVGEHDRVTPPEESEAIAAAIPGAQLDVIAGAGHLSNVEQPAAFTERVERFLEEQERATRRGTATGGPTPPSAVPDHPDSKERHERDRSQ